ncbi:cysteine-rich receptor-like protein kinase 6 [Lolium perenne]|uniref:cysteine-rich receptor-like protein kinase 6 n=1 Tax=Lolium perenne TaxID=4522 RepID=UPI0021EAAA97|nr:cysteine-rich receptor-like protein kinase 44 [Lolium perenne]
MLAVAGYGILPVLTLLLVLPSARPVEDSICDTSSRLAPSSSFPANRDLLAAALPANASSTPTGFATLSAGTASPAYAMALCRGDANASSCAACVAIAFHVAVENCPNMTGATMYEDNCVLRFANRQFLDFLNAQQWQVDEISSLTRTADDIVPAVAVARFSAAATAILAAVSSRALAADSSNSTAKKYFATGEVAFDPRIYALAQCVPLLTPAQCSGCFGQLLKQIKVKLSKSKPIWVASRAQWCDLRYSVPPLYQGQAMLQLQAPPPTSPETPGAAETKKKTNAAGISVGIVCSLVLISILSVLVFIRSRTRTKTTEHDNPFKKISSAQCVIFDLPALQEATENFSQRNKLGEGGFGAVYKGTLPDGQDIAVKKLLGTAGHGLHQLHNEVLLLAQLQHKNLVRLHGFYSSRDDTLLVYEYIKNGSLDNFLSDTREGHILNWEQQYNIILGIAKGILYLHEDSSMRIIHRDLKPNNILLDDDMEPKIADFGLARLLGEGHTHTMTSGVAGTPGYMAPEYVYQQRVSPKIDIFSYGVLVLQIVTRRRECWSDDINNVNLLTEVWNHWRKGSIIEMMDHTLDEHTQNHQLRYLHIGLMCVQADPGDRPEISTVIFMLTRDNMELQPPEEPAFFFGSLKDLHSLPRATANSNFMLEEDISLNGVTITDPYPR